MTGLNRILRPIGNTLRATAKIYGRVNGEQCAAAFAYYVLFSLFPLVALLLTGGSVFLSSEQVMEGLRDFLPLDPAQQAFIWESVQHLERARGGVSVVSVIVLLWSSLRFFQALIRGVNQAWHTVQIPWWQMPLKNLAMMAVLMSALFIGLVTPAVLQGLSDTLLAFEHFVHDRLPHFNLHLITNLLDLGRYVLGAGVLFYSFSLLYMLAPRRRVRFRQVWIAALLVTVALQVCQIAFVNYLPRFVNYGIYGAVGGMMLLLLWVYISGILIIFGGCLCAALALPASDEAIPSSSGN